MRKILMTIFAVLVGIVAYGQNSSYGNVCDQAIYVDSTLNQMIEPNETYFFTVNTEDLPLVVYFYPDKEGASEPQVYVDLTCIAGVYEDQNVRDIVDLAAAYDVYFPLSLQFDQLFVDGKTVYRVNYDRSLLDLLSLLGVDYSIPVYVAVESEVSGSIQVENKRTVSQCYDRCLRVEMQDTLYLKANEDNLFYFPVKEWQGKNLAFTWTGNTGGVRAYIETDCEFDTLTSDYIYDFSEVDSRGYSVQKVSDLSIDHYIYTSEDGNLYAMFVPEEDGTLYVGDFVDHGSVTLNSCLKNLKTTAIDFPATGMVLPEKIPSKSYRIEASTLQNKNIRMKWKTIENKLAIAYFANFCGFECQASDPDVLDTVHFVYNEQEQAMIADIPMDRINKIVKQNTEGWLFMQIFRKEAGTFSWGEYEIEEPDCDSKSILLLPNDSVYMPANHYNTTYKLVADDWSGLANTFTWRGSHKAFVFIADTCSFPLAPYNIHVGKYFELYPNQPVEISQKELTQLAKNYVDGNGNLYLRLRSDAEGALVTRQEVKVIIDTIVTTIEECESYEWHGNTYTQSGTYEHHSQDGQGKQTHEILHLTIHHGVTVEVNQSACDSAIWHDMLLTQSGIYYDTLQTIHGCDSVEILHLTLNYSSTVDYTAVACDEYSWNDATYTTSGVFTYRTQTEQGCDSIEVLYLTINYSDTVELTPVTATDSYVWHDVEYTESGTYTYLTQTEQGCDSLEILQITINSGAGLENAFSPEGTNAKLVMINQSLYIQVIGAKSIEYYDLIGRKVEIMD